jgi:hypothetical protein
MLRNAVKSTDLVDVLPLIKVLLQVQLPGRLVKSVAARPRGGFPHQMQLEL